MMQPIFASLGSNYNWDFARTALSQLFKPDQQSRELLTKKLEATFHGQAELFYKGRDAISDVLIKMGLEEDSVVLTQAFSCYAIEEAILVAGMKPAYVDLDENQPNLSVKTLRLAFDKNPSAKVVLVQHSLGIVADIKAIKKWCLDNNLYLIEDLAQAFGGQAEDGSLLGTSADAVVISFGRDKVLDASSGGASIIKNTKILNLRRKHQKQLTLPNKIIIVDLTYPLLTFLIRKTYRIGVGKILFQLARMMGMLKSPVINPARVNSELPNAYAYLVLWQWSRLPAQLKHRRQIADLYTRLLPKEFLLRQHAQIEQNVYLRFPIILNNPQQSIRHLKKHGFHISDRWYRKPVDCGSLKCQTLYTPSSCPRAEKLSTFVLNLPTHLQISLKQAEVLAKLIIKYAVPIN